MNVIMNPPYDGSLHLKKLNKVIKAYPESEIINLSPIRWLQDPFASDKKSTEFERFKNIRKHIADIEVISAKEANDLFGINLFSDRNYNGSVLNLVPYYYDEAKKYCEDSIKIRDNFKNFDFNKQEPQVAKVNVNRQRKLLHLTFDNF